jgi:ribonuclease Z
MFRYKTFFALIFLTALLCAFPAQKTQPMQLILLGTGYPYPSPDRAGPSCAIVMGEKTFIFDAGRGIGMRIAAAGISWSSIEAAFLTHLHSDHIDGLPDLFHSTWEFGVGRPFELYGPKGTKEIANGVLQFYGPDILIRRDLTEKLPAEGARINVHEIQEGVVYNTPEARITAFVEEHPPVNPAFGYRIDAGKHSVVITGDTRPNQNLVRFATGADILVHEAYVRKNAVADNDPRWSIYKYHSSAREAGEMAAKSKVKVLVLTHLMPLSASEQDFLDEARKSFTGKIIVGRDLLRLKLENDLN